MAIETPAVMGKATERLETKNVSLHAMVRAVGQRQRGKAKQEVKGGIRKRECQGMVHFCELVLRLV